MNNKLSGNLFTRKSLIPKEADVYLIFRKVRLFNLIQKCRQPVEAADVDDFDFAFNDGFDIEGRFVADQGNLQMIAVELAETEHRFIGLLKLEAFFVKNSDQNVLLIYMHDLTIALKPVIESDKSINNIYL